MEIIHLLILCVISAICFKVGQTFGKKEVEHVQSKYIQLQENEQLIDEYPDKENFPQQVETQEKEFKTALKELNELNEKDKQCQKLLTQLKSQPSVKDNSQMKKPQQQKNLISDKEFDSLLDEGFVEDQELNESELDQIDASR